MLVPFLWILGGGLLFGVFQYSFYRYKKHGRFKERQDLTLEELFARHFASSGIQKDEFVEIITELANVLHVPAGKLRPTDRFDKELKCADSFDDSNDELVFLVQQKVYKKTGEKKKDLTNVQTLEEYIGLVQSYR
jgi:hypothetical protein